MKFLIHFIFIGILFCQDNFLLIDGTVIKGTTISETDSSITIKTNYGEMLINKNDLVQLEYEVELNSGEKFKGLKISDTQTEIVIKNSMGELKIKKSDILDIKEVNKVTQSSSNRSSKQQGYRRSYSLADMLFGSAGRTKFNKDAKFALGEEKLIDTFFDPRAEVLDDGTLYLSGLSFAFGVSEKFQISSRWADYFWGNFNIRPKYQIFKKGNWERESALAIGGHFHTFWEPDKVVWKTGTVEICENTNEYDSWTNCSDSNTINKTVNYGGYFPMGASIAGATDYNNNNPLDISYTDDLDMMFEFFTAYTFSKARAGMRGRISSTVGALIQIPLGYDKYPYRLFGSIDIDVTPQLKLIGEAFYDPFFLDLNNRTDNDDCFLFDCMFAEHWTYKVSNDLDQKITEDQFNTIRPIHFDFGFMYAVNENFRIGIHNQPYILAFYWKF